MLHANLAVDISSNINDDSQGDRGQRIAPDSGKLDERKIVSSQQTEEPRDSLAEEKEKDKERQVAEEMKVDSKTVRSTAMSHRDARRDTLDLELTSTYVKSPDGRYMKLEEEIGRGSFKTVYKGVDCETGVTVAWCELMGGNTKAARKKFKEEAAMLKGLVNKNILRFYDSWEYNKKIVLVTELMTSGTLKQYIKRIRKNSVRLIANWCRQILKGLVFLHTRTPPVIHRDLKCDNFFINGQSGRVKIGDLGLAILKPQDHASTVIGTPEFMAPEMYDGQYDESADVYAFGLCMLEMLTSEYPYKECTNLGQIMRKVTKGLKPDSFYKIDDPGIREVIMLCIQREPKDRPTAAELLTLDFFHDWSVRMTCSLTDSADVLRFRVTDDVIRLRTDQKKQAEEVQFNFNLKTDNLDDVVQKLVNCGHLDEGNTKVGKKKMLEHIAYYRDQKQIRSHSLSDANQFEHSSDYSRQVSEPQALTGKRKSDDLSASSGSLVGETVTAGELSSKHTGPSQPGAGNVTGVQRKKSVTASSSKDSEQHKKVEKRKVMVLIDAIGTEDGSTVVDCELHTGKATVTFRFNCDEDNAADIAQNLVEYLPSREQRKLAGDQLGYIVEVVRSNKDQPDAARAKYEQKYNIPSYLAHSADVQGHSRTNSEVDSTDASDRHRCCNSSDVTADGVGKFALPDNLSPPLSVDECYTRDRSTTWSATTRVMKEDTRKGSLGETSSATQLSTIHGVTGNHIATSKSNFDFPCHISEEVLFDEGIEEGKVEEKLLHKKVLNMRELSKSIENILARDPLTGLTDKAYTIPQHRTRQLSFAARVDGELASPSDSYGTNSTALSNSNSLTCDSGFCSILPRVFRQNSISEPIAETTTKVGRFSVGVVKEKSSDSEGTEKASPITDRSLEMFLVDVSPVSHSADIDPKECVMERKCSCSPDEWSPGEDIVYNDMMSRHNEERQQLAERHQNEINMYLLERKSMQSYRELCSACSSLQHSSDQTNLLCSTHAVAHKLRHSNSCSVFSPRSVTSVYRNIGPNDNCSINKNLSELETVSKYLRSGKHHNKKEAGRGRRIRHNSVEQLMSRMMSVDDDTNSTDTESNSSTIREESTLCRDMDVLEEETIFSYPSADTRFYENSKTRQHIQDEIHSSHEAVLGKVQYLSKEKPRIDHLKSKKMEANAITQKQLVKQALDDSRARIVRSLDSFDSTSS